MNDRVYPVSISDAASLICGKRALILCHINPDGDALGSATALAGILKLTGGDGTVVSPSPVPDRLRFITGGSAEYRSGMESDFDLILTVDTASEPQLGELAHFAKRVALSFDHHESSTPYSPYILDPDAPAAGLVIYRLFCELEASGKICGDASGVFRRIFAAIAADTGSFKYSNVTPEAFHVCGNICAHLREHAPTDADAAGDVTAPIDRMSTAEISAALFDNVTKKDVDMRRLTYKSLRYICGGHVAVAVITNADRLAYDLTLEDLGGMVEHIRSIAGTVVGIALKQSDKDPKIFRGSARANIDFDVSAVAAGLSGGGHKRAAGFRVSADSAEEAIRIVEEKFGAALESAGIGGANG